LAALAGVAKEVLTGDTAASIEIGAAQEVIAAWAAQLAPFIVEFVAAARAPAPVFTLDITGGVVYLRWELSRRTGILSVSGHRRTVSQEALPIKHDSMNPFEEPGQRNGAVSYHLEKA
jgi:hypothetical protein